MEVALQIRRPGTLPRLNPSDPKNPNAPCTETDQTPPDTDPKDPSDPTKEELHSKKAKVKATSTNNGKFTEVECAWHPGKVYDWLLLPPQILTNATGKSVAAFVEQGSGKLFEIKWSIAEILPAPTDGDPPPPKWAELKASKHTVYITYAASTTASSQESIYYISCQGAKGLDAGAGDNAIADGVFKKFAAPELKVYGVQRSRSINADFPLSYHGISKPETPVGYSTNALLKAGTGACQGWANLFKDCLAVQGVASDVKTIVSIYPDLVYGGGINPNAFLLIKEWKFRNGTAPAAAAPFTHRDNEVDDGDGVPGQSNPEPPQEFLNHALTKVGTRYYDPSYGKSYQTLFDWEAASIAGCYRYRLDSAGLQQKVLKPKTKGQLEVKEEVP